MISTLPNDAQLAHDAVERWIDVTREPHILDLAYNEPDAPPPLVRAARAAGLVADDGLRLLVEQGALAFSRWTGAPLEPVRVAMGAALQESR